MLGDRKEYKRISFSHGSLTTLDKTDHTEHCFQQARLCKNIILSSKDNYVILHYTYVGKSFYCGGAVLISWAIP